MNKCLPAIFILTLICSGVKAGKINDKSITNKSIESDFYDGTVGLSDMEGSKKLHLRAGFKFALNLSNTNFNKGFPKPNIPVETVWKTGFSSGAFLEFPIISNVTLQQEYLYTYLRSELLTEETEYHLSYISLPLLLKLEVKSKFTVMAGPQVDVLTHAKEQHNGQYLNITHEVEERQIGAVVGVAYKLSKIFGFEAKFIHGINHVGMRQAGYTREFKLEQIQVGAIVTPF
ncbi:porin family protein [Pontibacter ramchanderi]|uniref:Outer membrane protein with beta-barrel domain n=1 Tax=Pontibacter ramchanderi TaxID=1179743 RepID=A0A2N3V1N9_9BACT|nr:porin family protein [Pontibacter ramchanderi]PKV75537.1 outer membrane protein with beta-barrel domain [Pontibacter ramchanderi]